MMNRIKVVLCAGPGLALIGCGPCVQSMPELMEAHDKRINM